MALMLLYISYPFIILPNAIDFTFTKKGCSSFRMATSLKFAGNNTLFESAKMPVSRWNNMCCTSAPNYIAIPSFYLKPQSISRRGRCTNKSTKRNKTILKKFSENVDSDISFVDLHVRIKEIFIDFIVLVIFQYLYLRISYYS